MKGNYRNDKDYISITKFTFEYFYSNPLVKTSLINLILQPEINVWSQLIYSQVSKQKLLNGVSGFSTSFNKFDILVSVYKFIKFISNWLLNFALLFTIIDSSQTEYNDTTKTKSMKFRLRNFKYIL